MEDIEAYTRDISTQLPDYAVPDNPRRGGGGDGVE